MSQTIQWIIVGAIMTAAVIVIIYRIIKKSNRPPECGDCPDCPLNDSCKKKSADH